MRKSGDSLSTGEARSSYVEFEERAAEIYLNFARRFRDNADLSGFWLGMCMAEQQHAIVLSFCECQHLLSDNLPTDSPGDHDLSELFRNLETRAAHPNLTVDHAFMIAAELEGSEINAIYERLVAPVQGTSYLTRKKIETLGENHVHAIAQAARRFGASDSVLGQLAQLEHKEYDLKF